MQKQMASSAALRRLMQQHLKLGRELIELATRQTEALVANDVPRLNALEAAQKQCVTQQDTLDLERGVVTRELGFSLGMERVPSLSELLPHFPSRERAEFEVLRRELQAAQSTLETLKSRNLLLLENALEYTNFSIDALTTAILQPARYGANLTHIAAPAFYIDSKA